METNDVLRRRQTPISSGFRQDLLQNDYLPNSTQNQEQPRSRYYPPSSLSSTQAPTIVNSKYEPPETFHDSPSQWDSMSQYHQQNTDSLLYLSTPKPASIRRTVQSQTPARTSVYDSNTNNTNSPYPLNYQRISNPARDYGADSLFSYGCCCLQCVRTTEVGILENFGRFEGLLEPGLHLIPWPLVDIGGRLSLRIKQLEVSCETKTSDSVFCTLVITLQFRIIAEKAYDAYYRLTDPSKQINSYIFDIIRSKVPKMTIDEVFESKGIIAKEVKKYLKKVLYDYGYEVLDSLLTDIRPADAVVQSMNEINASKRIKVAMVYKAEAEKIKRVKDAEAHCESLYLHGVGTAGQRKALVKEFIDPFKRYMEQGDSQTEIMNLLFFTQYIDTINAVSSNPGHDQSLLFSGGPGRVFEFQDQIQALSNR